MDSLQVKGKLYSKKILGTHQRYGLNEIFQKFDFNIKRLFQSTKVVLLKTIYREKSMKRYFDEKSERNEKDSKDS